MAGQDQATPASPGRGDDRFDATVSALQFVVHRQRATGWTASVMNGQYDILALATGGRAAYECDGERFDATRSTMLLFPRGVWHAGRSDRAAPWSFFSVAFRLDCDPAVQRRIHALPRHLRVGNITQISDLFRELERQWRQQRPGFLLACRGLVLLLLEQYVTAAEGTRHRLPHAADMEAIVQKMHAQVGRVDLVGDLARQSGLSASRFRLLFRQHTGCSVTRYQNRLRIAAARELLASGHYRVGEVADELGFRDVYYFSRLFKRITGTTPSACVNGGR